MLRRYIVLGLIFLIAAHYWWTGPEAKKRQILVPTDLKEETESAPQSKSSPLPLTRNVASSGAAEIVPAVRQAAIQLEEPENYRTEHPPLEQGSHQWQWLEGVRAIRINEHTATIPELTSRAGFKIVAESEVPEGVTSYSLVERKDNGLLGIFTGVLKAMGKTRLRGTEQFLQDCPAQVVQSYPHLRSYLLRPQRSDEAQELKDCLWSTGLFKHLEWEILDRPATSR